MVAQYFERKTLAELGYTFDGAELETFEADCFTIIDNELKRLESREYKKGIK